MDKHQILTGLTAGRTRPVDLADYGIDGVFVKKLTVADRGRMSDISASEKPWEELCVFLLTTSLVDYEGRNIFNEGDRHAITDEMPADLVERLVGEITKFSGIGKEESEKN